MWSSNMAALDEIGVGFIQNFLITEGKTTKNLSDFLQRRYPGQRGFSIRSIERFCQDNGIRRKGFVNEESLDEIVGNAVSQVGPVYGRKMMKGYLDSQIKVHPIASASRIAQSLRRVNPCYNQHRRQGTERQTNPAPYVADYYGHKLHMDQNEKLAMFGVTHVCAIDGYSRYIPAFSCMPIKNNVIIYNDVFRKVIANEGVFDQIRVDHGKEFYLTLYVQELLSPMRSNTDRAAYCQTQSKKNLRIERFWVEVNARVNYPIKHALRSMEERDLIDMEQEETKYCVSAVSLMSAKFGMEQVVDSWNYHPIPGIGTPISVRSANNRAASIADNLILSAEEAVEKYQSDGGSLTLFPKFGTDPLETDVNLLHLREQQFLNAHDVSVICSGLVNGIAQHFENAISDYCDITRRLAA